MHKFLIIYIFITVPCLIFSQVPYTFQIDDLNELIQNGTVQVTHSQLDIGSINDVFDHNDQTLARSANINPMVITLAFPFKVWFHTSTILQTYGDGWWTLEAADTKTDLSDKTGSYVEIFSMSPLQDGVTDAITFSSAPKRIIQLTVRRTTGDDYVHLNEWQLVEAWAEVDIHSICIRPSQLWLIPGSSYDIATYGVDGSGNSYPMQSNLSWSYDDHNLIAHTIQPDGSLNIAAINGLGSTVARADWGGMTSEIPVNVVEDFTPKTADKREVKVALVVINPPITAEGGLRFHERLGWDDPVDLSNALVDSLNAASGGVVDYKIVATYDEDSLYAALQGTYISVDSMYRLFLEPGWTTFHQLEQTGGFAFDYNGLLAAHNFCDQSNNGEIDEVWVYSMPFTGMYESRLTGEGAFWYNSPPLDGNSCVDQLPIMGLNYERGVAEALHSFGHRVESAMVHTFGRWDYNAVDKNDWEKFVSYDEVVPGGAHIGNIHFPPNGVSDYDYENHSSVITLADNWKRYPFLFHQERTVNCEEWGCSHLGYMSWWFRHLPHFTCKNKVSLLNNWWPYIVDYNEGRLLEKEISDCDCEFVAGTTSIKDIGDDFSFNIYPNPAKDNAFIELSGFPIENLKANLYNQSGISVAEL